MKKDSVYNGEVVGYTVGKLFLQSFDVINVQFTTLDDAQGHCDTMNGLDSVGVYFPIKLTSVANQHAKEHSFD